MNERKKDSWANARSQDTTSPSPFKGNYEVGYGKPPKATRFQKGQSGNPNGRPIGAKNKPPQSTTKLKDILLEEAYRSVTLQDKDGSTTMSMAQAAIRSLAVKAAKGSVPAQKLFLSALSAVEQERYDEQQDLLETAILYKQRMSEQIEEDKRHGRQPKTILPHPDHVKINPRTGEVAIYGPIDEDDKAAWDSLWTRKTGFEEERNWLNSQLAKTQEPNARTVLLQEIDFANWCLDMIDQALLTRWRLPAHHVTKDRSRQEMLIERVQTDTWPKYKRQHISGIESDLENDTNQQRFAKRQQIINRYRQGVVGK